MPRSVRSIASHPLRNAAPIALAALGLLLVLAAITTGAGASTPTTETVALTSANNTVTDTYIDEAEPAAQHNTAVLDITGNDAAGLKQWAGVRFDLAGYFDTAGHPQDVTVVSATLHLQVDAPATGAMTLTPRRLAAASTWDAAATWNNANVKWASGADGANVPIDGTTTAIDIDVTGDVQGFLNGSLTNNGWVIRAQTGAQTVVFHSSEATGVPDRPTLTIEYSTNTSTLQPQGATYPSDIAGAYEDTYVQPGAPSAANGALDHIRVGRSSTERMDILIRFDLDADFPDLHLGTVVSAQLVLPVKVAGVDRVLHAARICGPAGLSVDGAVTSATYNSIPFTALQSVQASPALNYTNGMAQLTFDVTAIVQAWADGEANLGFHVYQQSPIPAIVDWIDLYSFNEPNVANRPRLVFEYVADAGSANPTLTPACQQATPTPTNTNTPANTATMTNTPTQTPTGTQSPTQTPTSTSTATSTTAPGTATVTTSTQLVVSTPPPGHMVPRSRLTFSGASGTLDPASVSFVIKRGSDAKYWDGAQSEWVDGVVKNAAVEAGDAWEYAITGNARRLFVNTGVSVEMHATKGGQDYRSSVAPAIVIR